jgi:hypothetical protein
MYSMKTIKCRFGDFDFDRFAREMLRFYRKIGARGTHPSAYVTRVEKPGGAPESVPAKGRDTFKEELESGLWLFFPFCEPNAGAPVRCADGRPRKVDGDKEFCLGDTDTAGYLLGLKNGRLTIHSAVQSLSCLPPASVDIVRNCGVLDKPMTKFIQSFSRQIYT